SDNPAAPRCASSTRSQERTRIGPADLIATPGWRVLTLAGRADMVASTPAEASGNPPTHSSGLSPGTTRFVVTAVSPFPARASSPAASPNAGQNLLPVSASHSEGPVIGELTRQQR